MTTLSESTVESAALSWLAALGWQVVWERLLLDALLTKLVSGEL